MTWLKDAFFIGKTNVDYRVEISEDGKTSTLTYTLFVNDGFWDVDWIDEKVNEHTPAWLFDMPAAVPDGKGPNLERFGGTPYDFIPETIQFTFPTPTPTNDPKYDNPNRQY